jgi:hypothetical protein
MTGPSLCIVNYWKSHTFKIQFNWKYIFWPPSMAHTTKRPCEISLCCAAKCCCCCWWCERMQRWNFNNCKKKMKEMHSSCQFAIKHTQLTRFQIKHFRRSFAHSLTKQQMIEKSSSLMKITWELDFYKQHICIIINFFPPRTYERANKKRQRSCWAHNALSRVPQKKRPERRERIPKIFLRLNSTPPKTTHT